MMADVLIKCPITHEPVRTGHDMPKEWFEKAAFQNERVRCPRCGLVHYWDKEDAYQEKDTIH